MSLCRSLARYGKYMPMSAKTIELIKATAPVVAPHATTITQNFYPRLFRDNPEVGIFFNKTNQAKGTQSKAVAGAVVAFASNIDNLGALGGAVGKICNRHCGLGVAPNFYQAVHDALLASVVEVLGDAVTPEIGEAWSNAVMALAEILIETEEGMYQAAEKREGGWRGYKDFVLSHKERVGEDTVEFRFVATDNPDGGIQFAPGQYLSIRCDAGCPTPRHYTVTSNPGDPFLQCTTRHVKEAGGNPAGVLSSYMHTKMQEGDKVQLAPPFGVFTKNDVKLNKDTVFVTAGIGITLARSLAKDVQVAGHIHVDRGNDYTESIVSGIESDCGVKATRLYGEKREDILDAIKAAANPNADFVLCGPLGFMKDAKTALECGGAKNIHYELFGTGSM